MELRVIGSSSSGNCYILETREEALIVEAGVKFIDIKKALKFNLRKAVGCLCTHQHNDHAESVKQIADCGIHVLALREVLDAKGVTGTTAKEITIGKGYKFGKFRVIPFPAFHDVPCVGFLIDHPVSGRIMFMTDSCSCDYVFPNLRHILIECNYYDANLIRNIKAGRIIKEQRDRLMNSHMELNACKEFLMNNDLSGIESIVLLHLSNDNSDEKLFVSEIQKLTGKEVYAANPGLTISLR